MDDKILLIKETLQKALPGEKAQYKMAPQNRAKLVANLKRQDLRLSAVMMILFYQKNELHTFLLQRAQYKGHHSNQICFPGGKKEKKDKSLWDTSVRETFEEIHLSEKDYERIGSLSPLPIPISKMLIYPFVAFAHDISSLQIDNYENVDIFWVDAQVIENLRSKN